MTTTPDTPTPDDRDPAGASALEDYEANTKDAPGAELGMADEPNSFEPEEDPDTEK